MLPAHFYFKYRIFRQVSRIRLLCSICFFSVLFSCGKAVTESIPQVIKYDKQLVTGLKFNLPAVLKESSGLCYTEGNLWSFGDSGNPNAIYQIDATTGAVIQAVTITNYPNIDWEDITSDSLYIYVGDFGNNFGDRKDLRISKKNDLKDTSPDLVVNAEAINFSYGDQTGFNSNENTNFECGALVGVAGSLYVFTKDRDDLKTRCYKMPTAAGAMW